jgi:hypothetical protein
VGGCRLPVLVHGAIIYQKRVTEDTYHTCLATAEMDDRCSGAWSKFVRKRLLSTLVIANNSLDRGVNRLNWECGYYTNGVAGKLEWNYHPKTVDGDVEKRNFAVP